jgi:8-oxo-dGTP pyrophosphatase MutT (NUDIX family)
MNQYVLCFAHPQPHAHWPEVLLIEKKKPAWQAGRYNLPGGKIEPEETIHKAASRELQEETGIECPEDQIRIMGTIEGTDFIVYVCRCDYDSLRGRNVIESLTDETVFWMPLGEALRHPLLIENLRLIISFCRAELVGWHIVSDKDGIYILSDERNHEEANVS